MKEKKEKPRSKLPIPGTDGWVQVTTNKANVFYFHPQSKRSEWIVPDEIKHQVDLLNQNYQPSTAKRKQDHASEPQPILEFQSSFSPSSKRLRLGQDDDDDDGINDEKEDNGDGDENGDDNDNDDDDQEWQRQMANEMAAEAEANEPPAERPPANSSLATKDTATVKAPAIPLSVEEAKVVFMNMLTSLNDTSKEVNPMAPWDLELSKFINQPAYSSIPRLRDRQDVFNEWCKLRIREKRAQKKAATPANQPPSTSSSSSSAASAYRSLLEQEVKSTRAMFDEFRQRWKRDRRFFDFGRDDREREKGFKQWLQELGERKRKAALEAEANFCHLLSSKLPPNVKADFAKQSTPTLPTDQLQQKETIATLWKQVKRTPGLDIDPRYEAVGSSTRRAELFADWLLGKALPSTSAGHPQDHGLEKTTLDKDLEKKEKTKRALRDREDKVRREQKQIEQRNIAALGQATREESLVQYEQLLIDSIRDPLETWTSALAKLFVDPREKAPGLSEREKHNAFDRHIDRLQAKRRHVADLT